MTLATAVPGVAQLASDMDGSVVANSGDYDYNGEHYDPLTAGAVVDGAFDTVNGAVETISEGAAFLNRSTSFGAWRNFNNGNAFIGARGGLGIYAQRPFLSRGYNRAESWRGVRFGPLYIGDPYVGAGVLYSEYSGTPVQPGRFRSSDDPWAAIIWASVNVSAYVSDTFAFSFRPFVYYLPLEGKVGYSGLSSIFGFNAGLVPKTMLDMAYRVPLGNWDLYFYDRFDAVLAQTSIFEDSLFYRASVSDLSAYDSAGRYGFGGFGVPIADATGRADFDITDRLIDEDRLVFRNIAGTSLNGRLGEDLYANFFFERYDQWNSEFNHRAGLDTAGATIIHEHPTFSQYAGYRISGRDGGDTLQWAFVGANVILGPRLVADVMGGYMWSDSRVGTRESWIGQLRIEHQLGPFTSHGIAAGRKITDPEFGNRYLADFVRYYLTHSLSSRAELRLFAQVTDAKRLDSRTLSNYSSFVVGALLSVELSPVDSISFLNSYETYDLDSVQRNWELWTHRLSYLRRLSETCSANFFYQYQHGNSNTVRGNDFAEHLVYLGVVKRF